MSDPLPPTAAVPLSQGDNKYNKINECILPLEKGESRRRRAGGRSHVLFQDSLCKAFRRGVSNRRLRTVRFHSDFVIASTFSVSNQDV